MLSFLRNQRALLILLFISTMTFQKDSFGYGYKRNEDPLITAFKSVIFYGRKHDWRMVESGINTIRDRIDDVHNLFGVNIRMKLENGLAQHDFQEVMKVMANLVFLAMREKFYWNLAEELKMFKKAKVRLRLVEEYYTILLSGNVRKYDRVKGTKIHEMILDKLMESRRTLGSLGFLGAGAVAPQPGKFRIITNEIEEKLIMVFPYFETGEYIPFR